VDVANWPYLLRDLSRLISFCSALAIALLVIPSARGPAEVYRDAIPGKKGLTCREGDKGDHVKTKDFPVKEIFDLGWQLSPECYLYHCVGVSYV
jgi:hypothetical protein